MKSDVYVEFNLNQMHYTAFHWYTLRAVTDQVCDLRGRITCKILCLKER
jgi:hypothetical protein